MSALPPSLSSQIPVKPMKIDPKIIISTPVIDSTTKNSDFGSKLINTTNHHEIKESSIEHTSRHHNSAPFYHQSVDSNLKKSFSSTEATTNRSTASWNFSLSGEPLLHKLDSNASHSKQFSGLSAEAQHRIVITEVLNTLIGINGTLIVPNITTVPYETLDEYTLLNERNQLKIKIVVFDLNEQIQESVRDIISDVLPSANYFFQIQNFIETARAPESGQVLQALSSAMSSLITDYYGTVAQLESMHINQELNLHKLLFYLRPIIQTMETITKVCNMLQAHNVRGGNVLTRLHDNIALYSGDKNSQEILIYLTQKAAEPYMEILKLWIFKGIIHDPKMEFLVEDNEKECQNPEQNENYFDDYWEKRYVTRSERIPRFLEKQADVILRTGKYLNVVRECGKRVVFNQSQASLKFSHTDEQNYINIITDAYTFASKALLELIMEDNDLMGHLLSVKRYFLLQQGDFIVQFMDACECELLKNVDDVIPMRLENLLELTLRLSSAKHDKYQDDLFTMLLPFEVISHAAKLTSELDYDMVDLSTLKGIECFTFGYNVHWPLSIVLNQMTIFKYQLIFRQLFYCKFAENYLCHVSIANKNATKLLRPAFTLRQRMMNAIQNLEYYMMVEVIEPVWHILIQKLPKAKNIDEVLMYHDDFLNYCLKNCMLTYPKLLSCVRVVCNSSISFCRYLKSNSVDGRSSGKKTRAFLDKVNNYDRIFTKYIVELRMALQENAEKENSEKFESLSNRINFNNYYSRFYVDKEADYLIQVNPPT